MTDNEKLMKALLEFVEKCESQNEAASKLGVSKGFLSDVLKGNKPIGDTIPAALGYEYVLRKKKK